MSIYFHVTTKLWDPLRGCWHQLYCKNNLCVQLTEFSNPIGHFIVGFTPVYGGSWLSPVTFEILLNHFLHHSDSVVWEVSAMETNTSSWFLFDDCYIRVPIKWVIVRAS